MSIHYFITKVLLLCMLRLRFRIKIYGRENIPKSNYILAANHYSLIDPLFLAISVPDELHFIAKSELFHYKIIAFFLKSLNAFPVERGALDLSALRGAVNRLKTGHRLVIFPEGTRVKEKKRSNMKEGVGLIASMAKVDILPVSIKQSKGFRPKVEIRFNPLIKIDDIIHKSTKKDIRIKILDAIYSGIYGEEGMDR